jgi:hypothetical protein
MTHTKTQQKASRACDSEGLPTNTNSADFLSHGATNQAHDGKAIADQIARLALAGHVVHKGQSGDYIVSKYGMTRYCRDFAEIAAFARQLGVNHE